MRWQSTLRSAQTILSSFIPLLTFNPVAAWPDSQLHLTILPTTLDFDGPSDDPSCRSVNLSPFFDPPRPSGHLLEYIEEYGNELVQLCHLTRTSPNDNCFPSKERWCEFTSVAPTYIMSDYSTYGNQASSWWAAKSSSAVALASKCPNDWFDAAYEVPGGAAWLNDTIMFAACYEGTNWDVVNARASRDERMAAPGMSIRLPEAKPTTAP